MNPLTATNNALNKINTRYLTIIGVFILLVVADIAERIYKPYDGKENLLTTLLLGLFLAYHIFLVLPWKLSRIIRVVETGADTVTITTFGFAIKYFPIKLKPIVFEVKKEDIVYRKLSLNVFSLINNLPFAGAYSLTYNLKDYYLVPSLFNERDKVIKAVGV